MPFKYPSLIERIIANSVLSTTSYYQGSPCWEWIGPFVTNRSGARYGKILVSAPGKRTRTWLVHRLVLVAIKGRRMGGRVGIHLCNNTLCCAPLHLAGGTQAENVQQCVREGRHVSGLA